MINKTIQQLESELGELSNMELRKRLSRLVRNNDVLWPMLASLAASQFSDLQPDFAVQQAARRLLVCIVAARQYTVKQQWNSKI